MHLSATCSCECIARFNKHKSFNFNRVFETNEAAKFNG